jgi:hypothetical protein
VNLKQFDTNNDGQVTHEELCVYMIMAGWEESFSGYVKARFPMAWAHAWNSFTSSDIAYYQNNGYKINSADHIVSADGVELTDWAMMGELGYMSDEPQYADTRNRHHVARAGPPDVPPAGPLRYRHYNGGISVYSIMGAGSWGTRSGELPGSRPVNMDAWSRVYLGWESVKTTVVANAKGVAPRLAKL